MQNCWTWPCSYLVWDIDYAKEEMGRSRQAGRIIFPTLPSALDSLGRQVTFSLLHSIIIQVFRFPIFRCRHSWSHINWGFTVESAVANITLISDP